MGKDWLEEREAFLFNRSCKCDAYLAWGLGRQGLRSKAIILFCVAGAPIAQSSQKLDRALQFAGVEMSPVGRWRHAFPGGLSSTNCIPRPQLKSLVTFSYFSFFRKRNGGHVVLIFIKMHVENKVSSMSTLGMCTMQWKLSLQLKSYLRLSQNKDCSSPQMETI